MQLRPYQARAIAALRQAYAEGKRRILLVSPTGSGKTMMCTTVAGGFSRRDKKTAWFAHRRELVKQAVASFERHGLEVGHPENGHRHLKNQVVSVCAAVVRGSVPAADLCVLDEAHHFAADTWGTLPASYPEGTMILGATATPERGDGRPLDHIFDTLIVVAQPSELVATGDLVPCTTYTPDSVLDPGELAHLPVDAYLDNGMRGKRCVTFVHSVAHAQQVAAQFRDRGVTADVLHGELATGDRDKVIAGFLGGHTHVIVNVQILTEGWDYPALDCIILARRCGSAGIYMQIAGRGLRSHPGKEELHFFDLTGMSHKWGDPLADRHFSLTPGERGMSLPNLPAVPPEIEAPSLVIDPTITHDPLRKFQWLQKDAPEDREARLTKWVGQCITKGHKTGSAAYRYRGAYGSLPPWDMMKRAEMAAHEQHRNQETRGQDTGAEHPE